MVSERTLGCIMTRESVDAFLEQEGARGICHRSLRSCRQITDCLYRWLPEDKTLTRERLLSWRQSLKDRGYSPQTEQNYIKLINRYLNHMGRPDLRFPRGRAKDIAGQQFGLLTAIAPTGEKNRKDLIWHCRCQCGREADFPATRLLTGNTISCGCLRKQRLEEANQYIDGTSLRQALQEQVLSTRAESGYTGVTRRGEKWRAYIRYKGRTYSLGSYWELEDAVKARARGKELVRLDALGLADFYRALHQDDPLPPTREQVRQSQPCPEPPVPPGSPASRSDNTSGHTGVYRKRDKWTARITWQKVTYCLGTFARQEDAIAARQEAARLLAADPRQFREKYRKGDL